MSQEYVLSIVLVLGGILKAFGVEIPNDAIQGILTGIIAIWIAVRRYQKGDITPLGKRRY